MDPATVAGSGQEEEGDCQEAAGQDPDSGAGRLQEGRGPAQGLVGGLQCESSYL